MEKFFPTVSVEIQNCNNKQHEKTLSFTKRARPLGGRKLANCARVKSPDRGGVRTNEQCNTLENDLVRPCRTLMSDPHATMM
jgi:hypothetical protein